MGVPPPLQVAQCRECLLVRPLEVVEEEDHRPELGEQRDERLEHLDLLVLGSHDAQVELGKHRGQRRQPRGGELHAGERLAQRRGKGDIREVLLELGAARAADTDAFERPRQLVEQACLA